MKKIIITFIILIFVSSCSTIDKVIKIKEIDKINKITKELKELVPIKEDVDISNYKENFKFELLGKNISVRYPYIQIGNKFYGGKAVENIVDFFGEKVQSSIILKPNLSKSKISIIYKDKVIKIDNKKKDLLVKHTDRAKLIKDSEFKKENNMIEIIINENQIIKKMYINSLNQFKIKNSKLENSYKANYNIFKLISEIKWKG